MPRTNTVQNYHQEVQGTTGGEDMSSPGEAIPREAHGGAPGRASAARWRAPRSSGKRQWPPWDSRGAAAGNPGNSPGAAWELRAGLARPSSRLQGSAARRQPPSPPVPAQRRPFGGRNRFALDGELVAAWVWVEATGAASVPVSL